MTLGNAPVPLRLASVSHAYIAPDGSQLQVLDGIDVAASVGQITSLVGSSGSGKSTLLAIAGMLMRPSSGEVFIAGQPMAGATDKSRTATRRAALGFVFQHSMLIPQLTASENIEIAIPPVGQTARRRAHELLASVGLRERAQHLPGQLSGGEAQRVAVCRALANRPQVVLADEPTGSLDRESADNLRALLRTTADEGIAVVVATHEPRMMEYADCVIRLEHGRLVQPDAAGGVRND
jgi:ABC-type lipoprotein export system ATPase subunit